MKRIIILLLVFSSATVYGQGGWLRPNASHGTLAKGVGGDSAVYLPTGSGAPSGAIASYTLPIMKSNLYFDTTNFRLYVYSPKTNTWDSIHAGAVTAGWGLTGNTGTTAGTNFVGTTDAQDLVIKTNGTERSRWNTNGALAVGSGTDYGTSGNALISQGSGTANTWSNNWTWNNSTKVMTADSNTFAKGLISMKGDLVTSYPTLIETRRNISSYPAFTGSIGAGGSTEMNVFNNLDYRIGSHLYYDSTKNAIWNYLGYTNGWGIQFVPSGNTNNDIYNLYGKEIFSVDLSLQPSTGTAKRFMSRINSATLNLVDQNGTSYTSSANDMQLYQSAATMYATAGSGTSRKFSLPTIRVSPDGYNFLTDATALATYTNDANNTYSIYQNNGAGTTYNQFRVLKSLSGSYTLASGQKITETDYNGGVAYDGVRATSTVTAGFSNAEFYWKTTNTAGSSGERMLLNQDGKLRLHGYGLNAFTGTPATYPAFDASGNLIETTTGGGTVTNASSLTNNALVIGQGSNAVATTTTGTGVLTALGVNTGSAGAFVVNGGALGTPASGTVTNLTGTASININGTVGATTPTTGAFTTVTVGGNLIATTNATYDIGTSAGVNAFRDLFLTRRIVTPTIQATNYNDLTNAATAFTIANTTGLVNFAKAVTVASSSTTGSDLSITNSTLTTGSAASIALTGTAAASNTKTGLSITSSGANATSTQTVTGISSAVTNSGTAATNIAATFSASGGTNNYAIQATGNILSTVSTAASVGFGVSGIGNGLFAPGGNAVGIAVAGTQRIYIDGTRGGSSVPWGAGTVSPNSTLHANGSFATAYTGTATSLTANATHQVIAVTATGQTITLPTAVGISGRIYTIKLTASGTGTVATTSSQTIDGSTTYSLSAQYKYVTVQSDNANWNIIGNN